MSTTICGYILYFKKAYNCIQKLRKGKNEMTRRMFKEMVKIEIILSTERGQDVTSLAVWLKEIKHIYVK